MRTHTGTHLVDRQCVVRGVVNSVADNLAVRFLWFIPVDDCCCCAQHTTSDLQVIQGEHALKDNFNLNQNKNCIN